MCGEKGLILGFKRDGHLIVMNPKRFSSFEVDTEKLKAGAEKLKAGLMDIDELKIEKPSRSFFHRKLD